PGLIEASKDTANIGTMIGPEIPSSVNDAAIRAVLKIDPTAADELAKAAVPELIKALKSKDEGVRQGATYSLAKLGPLAKPAIPGLKETLKSGGDFSRSAACSALQSIGDEGMLVLLEMFKNPKEPLEVRTEIAEHLRWNDNPSPAAIEALTEALK